MFVPNEKMILGMIIFTYLAIRVEGESRPLSQVLQESKSYGTFVFELRQHGLWKYVDGSSDDDYTVLVVNYPLALSMEKKFMFRNSDSSTEVLKSFILKGKYDLATLKTSVQKGTVIKDLNDQQWQGRLHKNGALVTNGGTVNDPDIQASNGLAHGLNFLVIPIEFPENVLDTAVNYNQESTGYALYMLKEMSPGGYNDPQLESVIEALKEKQGLNFIAPNATFFNNGADFGPDDYDYAKMAEDLSHRTFLEAYCWEDLMNMVGQEQVTNYLNEKQDVIKVNDNVLQIGGIKFNKPESPQERSANGFVYLEL